MSLYPHVLAFTRLVFERRIFRMKTCSSIKEKICDLELCGGFLSIMSKAFEGKIVAYSLMKDSSRFEK